MRFLKELLGLTLLLIALPFAILESIIQAFRTPTNKTEETTSIPEVQDSAVPNTHCAKREWKIPVKSDTYIDYKEYIASDEWKESFARTVTLITDNHQCRMCGDDYKIAVHHITYINLGHEYPEDLVTLCKDCHEHTHTIAGKGAKHYPPIRRPY